MNINLFKVWVPISFSVNEISLDSAYSLRTCPTCILATSA